MSKINHENSFVPHSIRLLFDNRQLEMIKTLCLLYTIYQKSKRRYIKIPDIVFYYSLVNFGMTRLLESDGENVEISRNLYYRYQHGVNQVILEMVHLNLIVVKGDVTSKSSELGIRLTERGNEFIMKLGINYFSCLIDEYISVIGTVDNNPENKKKLMGVTK